MRQQAEDCSAPGLDGMDNGMLVTAFAKHFLAGLASSPLRPPAVALAGPLRQAVSALRAAMARDDALLGSTLAHFLNVRAD